MKQTTHLIPINLPFVEEFTDYHDIIYKEEDLRAFAPLLKRVKGLEIGQTTYGSYVGLFYIGRCPNKKDKDELLKQAGIILYEF